MIFKTPPLKYFVRGVSDIMLAVGQFGGYAVVRLCGCFIAQPYNLITVHLTTASPHNLKNLKIFLLFTFFLYI